MIQVERVDFVSVPIRNVENARRFYGGLLGLHESTTEEDVFPEFETTNVTLGMFMPESFGIEFVPSSGVALRVPDVEAARAELEAAGVEFRGETRDTGVCHMAICRDFDGNAVILHRRYAPPRHDGMSHRESAELQETSS